MGNVDEVDWELLRLGHPPDEAFGFQEDRLEGPEERAGERLDGGGRVEVRRGAPTMFCFVACRPVGNLGRNATDEKSSPFLDAARTYYQRQAVYVEVVGYLAALTRRRVTLRGIAAARAARSTALFRGGICCHDNFL